MNRAVRIAAYPVIALLALVPATVYAQHDAAASSESERNDHIGVAGGDLPAFDNPFGETEGEKKSVTPAQPRSGETSIPTDKTGDDPFPAMQADPSRRAVAKEPPFWYPIVVWQQALNDRLSSTMKKLQHGFSFTSVMVVFLISLIYALLHTMGPGHGKVILGTYFLTIDTRRQKKDAAIAGFIVSITHIGMAFVLSLFLYLFIHSLSMSSQRDLAELSKRIGGGFVILTGVMIMVITLLRKKLFFINPEQIQRRTRNFPLYGVAVLSGIVPCPLAWFVLVFSISFNIYGYGIISIIGMAIGAAVTVGTTGFLVIVGKEKVMNLFSKEKLTGISYWLRFAGGMVLSCIGIVMVLPSA
ncbi:MAG: hypothetical protein JW768_15450 [Chitinispirillaceae bacterium]|nr:hypothetical protein [Chitinispirillaceae bacterium]